MTHPGGPSFGPSPFGPSPGGPYPGDPYPAGHGFVPPPPRPPYDERSVAALLLLGTVIAAPVSVGLGVLGIRATRGGERRGRWCAVLAVVGGLLVPLVLGVGALLLRGTEERASDRLDGVATGDCVNVRVDDETFAATVIGTSCTDSHDAEVLHRGELDVFQVGDFLDVPADRLCRPLISERYRTELSTRRYVLTVILVGKPWEPAEEDEFLCLAGFVGGEQMSAPIGLAT